MRFFTCIILLTVGIVFHSCKPEPETDLNIVIISELDTNTIFIISRFGTSSLEPVFTFSNGNRTFQERHNLEGGADQYPEDLHRDLLNSDTLEIHFNDSTYIRHINKPWSEPFKNPDSINVYYKDPRNIYNANNFEKSRTGESEYKGVYHITQEDLEYAIEVNE